MLLVRSGSRKKPRFGGASLLATISRRSDDANTGAARKRRATWIRGYLSVRAASSVQRHAKHAAEEGRAVVLLLDAAVGNVPHIGRDFVAALFAEGEPGRRSAR